MGQVLGEAHCCNHRRVDLDLLKATLADIGEPSYRAGQVWEWLARGAASYAEMTNLPSGLCAQLEERVALSARRSRTTAPSRRCCAPATDTPSRLS